MNDTIVAIATAIGQGGVGIIRISGSDTFSVINKIFSKNIMDKPSHTIHHGNLLSLDGLVIDDVLVSIFRNPKSYTGEDVAEISCHGNMIVLNDALKALLNAGARLAEPGEFTKRAFLNGKLDLSQAESVNDLIKSQTETSKNIALRQLQGGLSEKMSVINRELLKITAEIEASIDFPEDVHEPCKIDLESRITNCIDIIDKLIKSNEKSYFYREGMKIAILGNVNVGKSSILNALLDTSRAIVTDVPGTTRDVLEESLDINGIPVSLVDTAGVRETSDIVEKIGVERSWEIVNSADLVLIVLDGSKDISENDKNIISKVIDKDILFIINKTDLGKCDIIEYIEDYIKKVNSNSTIVKISAKNCDNIETLKKVIYNSAIKYDSSESLIITNRRHIEALNNAVNSMKLSLESLQSNMELDFVSIDIADARYSLGLITGATCTEDILNFIFSEFCIGK